MTARLPRTSLLAALALAACATSNQIADLANNEVLYRDVPFATKAPGDRPVFVAPLADARGAAELPAAERGFPIRYAGDDFWERPVPQMVGDVLVRQLEASGLFAQVAPHASPDALVIVPALTTFVGGATEAISGGTTFAEVALRVQVYGPAADDGKRALLHEQVYGGRQASPLAMKPVSPYRLYGPALQQAITKLLTGLDGSNVARSHVPLGVFDAAEAAAPR